MTKRAKKTATQRGPRGPQPADREIGIRLHNRRVELGLSQDELGNKLGVSFQQVQKYEKGVNRIGAARLDVIAKVLDVPITYFYEESGIKGREAESLIFADAGYNLRLLRAYAAIDNITVQRHFVSLMEQVAGIVNE